MDNPGQHLIHLTNRGPAVFNQQIGGIGNFMVATKQPLKDINKFGLLHYSIPKMCDTIHNEQFFFRIKYKDGTDINILIRMPNLDYYSMLISQIPTQSGRRFNYEVHRIKNVLYVTCPYTLMTML